MDEKQKRLTTMKNKEKEVVKTYLDWKIKCLQSAAETGKLTVIEGAFMFRVARYLQSCLDDLDNDLTLMHRVLDNKYEF